MSGESATHSTTRTTKTVAAMSLTPASVAHPRRSVPLVSAMSTKPTSVANTRKSTSSVPVASSRSTLEASTKRSTSSSEKAIPVVNLISDNEEDEDVDAPAYDFYSDDSDEDSEEDVGDIEEIEAEESPPGGQAENSPSGLRVTFDTDQTSARRILSEPEVLEKSVQKLKVRSPEQLDMSQLTPRQRAQLNVRNAKASAAPRVEEQMDIGSPKCPTVAPPGFPKEPVNNPDFIAAKQQFINKPRTG